jgi:hypothetical protein
MLIFAVAHNFMLVHFEFPLRRDINPSRIYKPCSIKPLTLMDALGCIHAERS